MKNIKLGTVPSNYKKTKKGNIIPFDWEVKDFYSCVSIVNGQVDPTNPPYIDMKHVGLENIEKHTGRLLFIKTAREEKLTSGKYFFNKGTVLYGKIRPELRKVYYAEFDGICSADIYPLKPKENLYPKFLKYLITDERFYRFAVSASMRTGMPKINRDDIGGYYFLIPKKAEQEQIANILSTWDQAIELKERLIEEKKIQKTGLIQKLYTGKIRIPGFSGKVQFEKLNKYIKESKRRNRNNEEERVLSVSNKLGFVLQEDQFDRIVASKDLSNYKVIRKGQFAYNPSRVNVGSIDLLTTYESGLLSPMYVVFQCKQGLVTEYLYHFIKSDTFLKIIPNLLQGSVRDTLSFDSLGLVKIFLPSIEEQNAIAQRLNLADKEISLLEKELEGLKQQKKGLMQLLLTGIIRVNTQENEKR